MENKKPQNIFARSKACQPTDSSLRKSSSDLQVNKCLPRNSRRREQPTTNRNDSQRNSKQYSSVKARPNVDKRPRQRGGGTVNNASNVNDIFINEDNLTCATEDVSATSTGLATLVEPVVTGALAKKKSQQYADYELNSVYAPGSKKQNLNHLLNFHYAPRDGDNAFRFNVFGRNGGSGSTAATKRQGANNGANKRHRYNKEQFLQANFQFVVKSGINLSVSASPDNLIDWNLIEQINIQTEEEPQCPICLYPPIAAKLTRCGHAYCWPCILHYLALSDKTWRKCPICYEAVHTADLKSTTIEQQRQFSIGDEITFQLMRRKKGCMLIEKFDPNTHQSNTNSYPLISAENDSKSFSKFLIAKRSDILKIIDREQRELVAGQDPASPEYIFIQQALDLQKERREKVEEMKEDKEEEHSNKVVNKPQEENENDDNIGANSAEIPSDERDVDGSGTESIISNDDNLLNTSSLALSSVDYEEVHAKYYYFYQSVDGQNIFLHPLNVKMLQACYGALEHAPLEINARVLQKEYHSMDEEHRRKFTCLGHLPLTCQFAVIEVDMQPPFVSNDILRVFKDDILMRKKERQRREREERRREKHINEINDRQMGKLIASTANLNLTSAQEFPTWGFEEALPGSDATDRNGSNPIALPKTKSQATYSTVAVVGESPNVKEYWPTLASPSSSSNNMYHELSTWGKNVPTQKPVVTNTAVTTRTINSERSSECESLDGYFAESIGFTTPMRTDLGDVLAMAITQKKQTVAATANAGGKKNKKAKKMTPLFSTGINYAGK
ncbi:RING finger protein 10 [Zeugodacus cucurbitae]|nr:RING finger protein 10 [Zeugodacus cucurbitae]